MSSEKKWYNCKIGEMAEFTDLAAGGGKFYEMGEQRYCDMPTASFHLLLTIPPTSETNRDQNSKGLWERIE